MSEEMWRERAQTAEARIQTLNSAYAPAIEKVKQFKANFGVKERPNGDLDIDFEKFVKNLGVKAAFELRKVIDEQYHISGEPGKKPHIKAVT
jgi:hypothetical protein